MPRNEWVLPFALLLSLAQPGCSRDTAADDRSGAIQEPQRASVRPLAGRVLNEGEFLGRPGALVALDTYLVVLDDAGDSIVHVLRRADGTRARSFGRRGAGPGEYMAAWTLVKPRTAARDEVWIFDVSLQRLTHVALGNVESAPAGRLDTRQVQLRGDAPATSPQWVGDSILITPGFFPDARFARFGPTGELRDRVGPLPEGHSEVPPQVRQHAFVGTLARSEARGLVALATRHADRIEIYRPDGELVRRVRGPLGFDPRFTVGSGEGGKPILQTGDDLRFGYVDVAATDDRIFALFSGRTRGDHGPEAVFGRHVHVYDWSGRLLEVIELDADLLALTVDVDGGTLYGVRHDPVPAVIAYPLAT